MSKHKIKTTKQETSIKTDFKVPKKHEIDIDKMSSPKLSEKQSQNSISATEINHNFRNQYAIYIDVLSPQLQKNEKLKRQHKTKLMNNIFRLLKWQFRATYGFTFIFITLIACNQYLDITDNMVVQIFDFLKFYITTIIAELIAILFFIVRSVFDKSIVDLFKNFDKNKTID